LNHFIPSYRAAHRECTANRYPPLKEEKALFSRVGRRQNVDYDVAFADSQSLQRLCSKMRKCLAILGTTLEVASGFDTLWKDLQARTIDEGKMGATRIEMYKSHIRNRRESVVNLLDNSDGVAKIVGCLSSEQG
jgi:hypothetical protein